ncbi:thioredoxin family protein [Metallibacterium scheffleri]|uniref:thioredoxin family protein n=1 Tax=Metallibacterium scheffleri TaxID=993689 RepID=UPI0018D2E40A|nr:thioredoxin family protein [Metallibacterium scheffleri]
MLSTEYSLAGRVGERLGGGASSRASSGADELDRRAGAVKVKVQLLVSKWCPTCPQAEKIWTEAAQRVPMEFEILDVAERKGREVASRLRIRTVPAVVIDDVLKMVGAQPLADVLKVLGV